MQVSAGYSYLFAIFAAVFNKVVIFTIAIVIATKLHNKLNAYQELSKDKRTLHLVIVTTNGVLRNNYYNMIQNEITMDDLFAI